MTSRALFLVCHHGLAMHSADLLALEGHVHERKRYRFAGTCFSHEQRPIPGDGLTPARIEAVHARQRPFHCPNQNPIADDRPRCVRSPDWGRCFTARRLLADYRAGGGCWLTLLDNNRKVRIERRDVAAGYKTECMTCRRTGACRFDSSGVRSSTSFLNWR